MTSATATLSTASFALRSISTSAAAALSAHSRKVVISPTISLQSPVLVPLSKKRDRGNASHYWAFAVPVHIAYDN